MMNNIQHEILIFVIAVFFKLDLPSYTFYDKIFLPDNVPDTLARFT